MYRTDNNAEAAMIGLVQRVTQASVEIAGETVAAIDHGILVLVGVAASDQQPTADRLLEKLLQYRLFDDQDGRMNKNVQQVNGGVLLVPQFTLVADTSRGLRPGFSRGASPQHARVLFEYLSDCCRQRYEDTGSGRFAADMKVHLTNDGPVTFWLQVDNDPVPVSVG